MLPGPNRARARKPAGIIIRKLLQCLGKRQWGLELGGKNGRDVERQNALLEVSEIPIS